jgi:excinuclease ABC subunit C
MTAAGKSSYIESQIGTLPDEPGIYIFRDAQGRVLYVGKAKSLRKRVMSYFRKAGPGSDNIRIARMVKRVHDLEFVITGSETEALLLESNFIKHHRPPYNISLRDDKSYPYVAVTLNEEFPRVIVTRKPHRPGVAYFGPFTNAGKVRETLDLLGKTLPYRKCRRSRPGRRSGTPCLNYHIGLCLAPCDGRIEASAYRDIINRVTRLLSGRSEGLVDEIRTEMASAAAGQNYERAAVMRDRLRALEHLLEKQKTSALGVDSMDVIGVYNEEDAANVQVLQIRDGLLSDRHSFFLEHTAGESETVILEQFVIQYYNQAIGYPSRLIVPEGFSKSDVVGAFLTEQKGARVEVKIARRGRPRELSGMAARNAELAFKQDRLRQEARQGRPQRSLSELKEVLGLRYIPARIECYDISNIGGDHAVGSMVVFEGGTPQPSHYRRFQIRQTRGPDDFAMMAEVLARRFSRQRFEAGQLDHSFSMRPDLIILDGGAGQVSAVKGALAAIGEKSIPVIGIAKRQEEIFRSGVPEPLRLPRDSEALALVQRLRDEAHRFALDYHRKRRDRAVSSSILDEIPGIGPARKKVLLEYFGSPERFMTATRDELESVPGLPAKVAREAYTYVHRFGRD